MRATSISITRVTARGRLSVAPTLDELATDTDCSLTEGECVRCSAPPAAGRISLFKGGEFKIASAHSVDRLRDSRQKVEACASELGGEIEEFEPLTATLAGDLGHLETSRIDSVVSTLKECPAATAVVTPSDKQHPADIRVTVQEGTGEIDLLLFINRGSYAVTDVTPDTLETIESRILAVQDTLNETVFDTIRL